MTMSYGERIGQQLGDELKAILQTFYQDRLLPEIHDLLPDTPEDAGALLFTFAAKLSEALSEPMRLVENDPELRALIEAADRSPMHQAALQNATMLAALRTVVAVATLTEESLPSAVAYVESLGWTTREPVLTADGLEVPANTLLSATGFILKEVLTEFRALGGDPQWLIRELGLGAAGD